MHPIIKQFFQRDAHPFIQFIKYGIAGCIATGADMVIFFALSWTIFPALTQNDILVRILGLDVTVIDEAVRSRNYIINRSITFLFSNMVAYIVNVLWVFKPGRHKLWVEIGLFYAVSSISYVIGTTLGWALIRVFGWTTTFAYLGNLIAALLINYACRKFLIFKG
jgi:putative flippase GtrA